MKTKMNYPIKLKLSYDQFIKQVKNIHTCCAFIIPEGYINITDKIIDKLKTGELVITEYHDEPLGEVIYISPSSKLN